jgi:ABC transport system ATP-binding/permease protein
VQLAYVDQSREALDGEKNVWEEISGGLDQMVLGERTIASRAYVAGFNFKGSDQQKKVGSLSGGERNRLHMAKLLASGGNLLILDEPTNDLDTDMLAAMEDLLDSWPGTLLVVSHDRYLVERVTDQQFAILDSRMRHLPGGVDEYLRLRAAAVASAAAASAKVPVPDQRARSGSQNAPERAQLTLGGADRRTAEKELAAAERKLAKLADSIRDAHVQFAEHDQSDYVGLQSLQSRLMQLETETAHLEDRWLVLTAALEG